MRRVLMLLAAAVAAGLASPLAAPPAANEKQAARPIGLRSLFVGCLDSQIQSEDDSGDFMSCVSEQLRGSGGELKLFPGVTLSAEDVNMSGNGQRAISGHAIKVALPWTEGNARFFGGWNNPSLVLSGGESELDIGVEVDKEDPNQTAEEGTGRGKKLKKILIPLMIGLKLKSALISMLSYGAVIAMAGKALLLSIVAIAIAGIGAMRRMYKDYSDTAMPSYSSYEPSYSSASAYHHRSYGGAGGPAAPKQLASASSSLQQQQFLAPAESQQQPQLLQPYAHELAFRGYNQQHQAASAAASSPQQQQTSQQTSYAQ